MKNKYFLLFLLSLLFSCSSLKSIEQISLGKIIKEEYSISNGIRIINTTKNTILLSSNI